ncbi:hypothetical protein BGX21_008568 [Mortierella sp. AD011]|nr:hypothetical protein BGX20_001607 [Mortierella sp. AD010]KAF9397724.1 hypothetical protein BGX21_008568 [Mortierella sp. AD011]
MRFAHSTVDPKSTSPNERATVAAAERFGRAVLQRHQASLEDVNGAFRLLIEEGNIDRIIGLYACGMQQHDVGAHDFKKEEDHCNSMRFSLLANIHPSFRKIGVETTIAKRLFVLEWKSLQIDYIKVGSGSPLQRANALADIRNVSEVLDLRFRNDKFRADMTIREWILSGPQDQLREYAQSAEIQKWKDDGYTITPVLAVVVGSRHVLLWNLDGDELDASPRLALE